MMTLRRFETLVEAYGADPERWPPRERAAATALVAGSAEARRLRDAARRLDRVLAAGDPAARPAAPDIARLAARATAASQKRHRFVPPPVRPLWGTVVATATACAAALTLAWFDPVSPAAGPGADIVLVAASLDGLEGED